MGIFTTEQLESPDLRTIITKALDKAERHWKMGGNAIALESYTFDSAERVSSKIPNHPLVSDDKMKTAKLIALVVDMRGSSLHSDTPAGKLTHGLKRIYYETSALLPALAHTIKEHDGSVTEFLGDGVLSFFPYEETNATESIQSAINAAEDIIFFTRKILNEVLYERYSLPAIDLGVGLSISETIIGLVGIENAKQPKAFGKCVFNATKLSSGINNIHIDSKLVHNDYFPCEDNLYSDEIESRGIYYYIYE